MKAWQFTTASGGLENTLFMPASGAPRPTITDDQVLVEVYSAALNPADHKVPEMGIISKGMIPSPCTPGMDFCGKVAATGSKVDNYKVGEMVFGSRVGKIDHGSLGQFIAADKEMLAAMPEGLEVDDMAGVGVAGLTAYQSIHPNVKEGDKVFINGGSGGTGTYGIQIAKALGCHVTTSCSSANIPLCKSLGADEVLDYKTTDIVAALISKGQVFTLIVDNVGTPANLYKASPKFLIPKTGKFCQIGASFSLRQIAQLGSNMLLPGFLGGGKNKYEMPLAKPSSEELAQIGRWMKEGKVRTVVDEVFEFEKAPEAFKKLKTGRARGKVIVHIK
ncbi:GroES-like protein [Byssothecium circinans]|uniref:GroES-like protein n=1 Tax=Byssothecium circinans TaxID=147558 RepID=A0A6A5TKB9_9PLEO|nr:GroES-like protein [Byssothecium circinans]